MRPITPASASGSGGSGSSGGAANAGAQLRANGNGHPPGSAGANGRMYTVKDAPLSPANDDLDESHGESSDDHRDGSENKRKRGGNGRHANREAVRKYRARKKLHTQQLEEEVEKLRTVNGQLMRRIQRQSALEQEVMSLRMLVMDIRQRIDNDLRSIEFTPIEGAINVAVPAAAVRAPLAAAAAAAAAAVANPAAVTATAAATAPGALNSLGPGAPSGVTAATQPSTGLAAPQEPVMHPLSASNSGILFPLQIGQSLGLSQPWLNLGSMTFQHLIGTGLQQLAPAQPQMSQSVAMEGVGTNSGLPEGTALSLPPSSQNSAPPAPISHPLVRTSHTPQQMMTPQLATLGVGLPLAGAMQQQIAPPGAPVHGVTQPAAQVQAPLRPGPGQPGPVGGPCALGGACVMTEMGGDCAGCCGNGQCVLKDEDIPE